MSEFDRKRERMVVVDIQRRGVRDESVLKAMRSVPRHEFVQPDLAGSAYDDHPLSIGNGQTISQPYIVALMIEKAAVLPTDRALEIGTGSGYAAAVLSKIAGEVYTVETIESLATSARDRLGSLGYRNVHVLHGDGSLGWKEHAPYDVIIVTAGAPSIPESLKYQLAVGGRLVVPVSSGGFGEVLTVVTKLPDGMYSEEEGEDVAFVPLVGQEGYRKRAGGH
jgi:protein-L-isoaspartate(D-aspartate) O-methyltransferase